MKTKRVQQYVTIIHDKLPLPILISFHTLETSHIVIINLLSLLNRNTLIVGNSVGVTTIISPCYLTGYLSCNSYTSFCVRSDYIITSMRCRALLGEIIVRLTLLVSEPSKLLYPKFSLAADYHLRLPAIHPVFTCSSLNKATNVLYLYSSLLVLLAYIFL